MASLSKVGFMGGFMYVSGTPQRYFLQSFAFMLFFSNKKANSPGLKGSCSKISNLFVHREKVVNSRWSLTRGVAYTRYNTVLAFFVNEK